MTIRICGDVEMTKLPELCSIQYGYAFDSTCFTENSTYLPLVRIRDVKRGYSETFYSGRYSDDYVIDNDSLLVGMDGEFNIARWKGGKALLNQRVCKITAKKSVDEEYIRFALTKELKEIENKTSFVTVKHLSAKTLNDMEFSIPSYKDQMLISGILTTIEKIIFARQQQIQKLDGLVKARFVELFGDPVYNSKRLPIQRLCKLGSLDRGRSQHRPRNDPKLLNGPYPLIQTGEVASAGLYITKYKNTYSELGLRQSKMWSAGTLCITIAANIAQTAILTFDACFPDSVVGFLPNDSINAIYMHYWFGFFQKILEKQAPQVAQKNINLKILSELNVIVPTQEKQEQFAAFVEQTDKSKAAVQKALDEAQLLFDSLMQKYFQ